MSCALINLLDANLVARYYKRFGVKVILTPCINEADGVHMLIRNIAYFYEGDKPSIYNRFHNIDVQKLSNILTKDLEKDRCRLWDILKRNESLSMFWRGHFEWKEGESKLNKAKTLCSLFARYLRRKSKCSRSKSKKYLKEFFTTHNEGFLEIGNYIKYYGFLTAEKFDENDEALISDVYVYTNYSKDEGVSVLSKKGFSSRDDVPLTPFYNLDNLQNYLEDSMRRKYEAGDVSVEEMREIVALAKKELSLGEDREGLKEALARIEKDVELLESDVEKKDIEDMEEWLVTHNKNITTFTVKDAEAKEKMLLIPNQLDKSLVDRFYNVFKMLVVVEKGIITANDFVQGVVVNRVYIYSEEIKVVYQNVDIILLAYLMSRSLVAEENKILKIILADIELVKAIRSYILHYNSVSCPTDVMIYSDFLSHGKDKLLLNYFKVNKYGLIRLYDEDEGIETDFKKPQLEINDKEGASRHSLPLHFIHDIYAFIQRRGVSFRILGFVYNINSFNFSIVDSLITCHVCNSKKGLVSALRDHNQHAFYGSDAVMFVNEGMGHEACKNEVVESKENMKKEAIV